MWIDRNWYAVGGGGGPYSGSSTYNEADNIINIIESVLSLSLDFNILIVDDNTDIRNIIKY